MCFKFPFASINKNIYYLKSGFMLDFFNIYKIKVMVNDVISDCLTRIRNASLNRRYEVEIPKTRSCQKICNILKQEGFIENISHIPGNSKYFSVFLKYKGINEDPCITNVRRISKPGVRIYANHKEMPEVLGGMGLLILSTSRGIITNKEARLYGIGGELLCSIW